MRRRQLLTLAGTTAAGALAGCSIPFTGSRDGGGGGGGGGDGQDTPTPTLPPISEAVEVQSAELEREDPDTFAEKVVLSVTAENTSDVRLRDVQFRVEFLSESGDVLDERVTQPRDVRGGRVWSFTVQSTLTGSEASEIQDYNLEPGTGFGTPEPTESG